MENDYPSFHENELAAAAAANPRHNGETLEAGAWWSADNKLWSQNGKRLYGLVSPILDGFAAYRRTAEHDEIRLMTCETLDQAKTAVEHWYGDRSPSDSPAAAGAIAGHAENGDAGRDGDEPETDDFDAADIEPDEYRGLVRIGGRAVSIDFARRLASRLEEATNTLTIPEGLAWDGTKAGQNGEELFALYDIASGSMLGLVKHEGERYLAVFTYGRDTDPFEVADSNSLGEAQYYLASYVRGKLAGGLVVTAATPDPSAEKQT